MKSYFAGAAVRLPVASVVWALAVGQAVAVHALTVPSAKRVAAAMRVKQRHEQEILSNTGVVGMAVGLAESGKGPAIHVYVDDSAGNPRLPQSLEGVTVRRIDLSGPITPRDQLPAGAAPLGPLVTNHTFTYAPPLPLGISTGPQNDVTGTMGLRIKQDGTGLVGWITNSHVAADSGPPNHCPLQVNPERLPVSLPQTQPGSIDLPGQGVFGLVTPLGSLTQAIPLVMAGPATGFFPEVSTGLVNTVDAAFVPSTSEAVSASILDLGSPPGQAAAALGNTVCKSGRTTGLTVGTVFAVGAELLINYTGDNAHPCGSAVFVDQIVILSRPDCNPFNVFDGPGDSGSGVVLCSPLCARGGVVGGTTAAGNAVGLFFAGTQIAPLRGVPQIQPVNQPFVAHFDNLGFANAIGSVLGSFDAKLQPPQAGEGPPGKALARPAGPRL